jgi:sterol 3beta-glucosyltransferase
MRIDLLAIGSRGDVQPFIALGLGLQKAGHRVRIVTLDGFADLVVAHGLEHCSIGRSPRDIAASAAGREWVERRSSTRGFLRGFVRVAASLIEAGVASYWGVCQDVDAIIVSGMGLLVGVHIADRLRIPLIRVQLSPFARTHYDWAGHKNFLTAVRGEWTAFLHTAFRFLLWTKLRSTANAARQSILSLPPLPLAEPFSAMDRKRLPVLDAYSPAIVPRPPDWGDWIHVTGYWFLDDSAAWAPAPALLDFLKSGRPPVFVGFGSTPFPQPEATTHLVLGSLERAGQRGVIVAGGSGLPTGRLSDDVVSLESVPHSWLFPRVAAAVHHGGAGVTGAALCAGLPSVVTPVFADQPFWGGRVFSLGAGPHPIPAKQLTEENLANAIRATANPEIRQRAAALGERIRAENGVLQAVTVIHRQLECGARNTATH